MGRIQERFRGLEERGERALVAFVTAGDPDLETTEALVSSIAESGADLIELGVPFSDPIAEGPTIQRASARALAAGATLRRVLGLVGRLRDRIDIPLLLMGYANPIHAMGPIPFAEAASQVGVDGIIVPDLPPEEGEVFFKECRAREIDPVFMVAPTTTPERLAMLVARTRGFLYCVSVQGVTGARKQLAAGVREKVELARTFGDIPICVGFGISRPEHAEQVGHFADGVIVGSAYVDVIERAESRQDAVDAVARLTADLKAPLRVPLQSG